MKRFAIQFILIHLIAILAILVFGMVFNYSKNQNLLIDYKSKRQWVDRLSMNIFDYAVLGSSRAHGAFDMKLLDSLLQKKGVNIGADGSGHLDNYLSLYRFIKQGNKIDKLFLVVDQSSLNSEESFSSPFHPFDYLSQPKTYSVDSILKSNMIGVEGFFYKYFKDAFIVQYNREVLRLALKNGLKSKADLNYFDENIGGVPLNINQHLDVEKTNDDMQAFSHQSFNERDLLYLNMILNFCVEREIKVIAISPPIFANSEELGRLKFIESTIDSVLTSKGVNYITPTSELSIDPTNFKDKGHLNNTGIKRYSHFIAEEIDKPIYLEEKQ